MEFREVQRELQTVTGNFAVGYFAVGYFAVRKFRRKEISP